MKTGIRPLISLLLLALGLSLIACSAGAQAPPYKNVDVSEMLKLQKDSSLQLVDVRSLAEFQEGHISSATNIDVLSPAFQDRAVDALQKEQPVLVYCRTGGRSRKAAAILARKGYRVYNLKGGYKAYTQYAQRSEN